MSGSTPHDSPTPSGSGWDTREGVRKRVKFLLDFTRESNNKTIRFQSEFGFKKIAKRFDVWTSAPNAPNVSLCRPLRETLTLLSEFSGVLIFL